MSLYMDGLKPHSIGLSSDPRVQKSLLHDFYNALYICQLEIHYQNCPPGFQVTSEFVLFDLVFKRLFFLSLALLFHLKCLSNSTSSRMRVVFLILSDSHVTLL